MKTKSEDRLLKLVHDYIGGDFTMQSEKPLIEEISSLVSPTLSADDVVEVLFEGDVTTPEEGITALLAFVQTKDFLTSAFVFHHPSVAPGDTFVKQPPMCDESSDNYSCD